LLPVSQHSRVHRHLPHVRDVGQRPSHRDRMGLRKQVIWGARKQKYFFEQVLTRLLFFRIVDLPVVSNLPQSRGYTLLVVPANAGTHNRGCAWLCLAVAPTPQIYSSP
jgi:hypothetical protein